MSRLSKALIAGLLIGILGLILGLTPVGLYLEEAMGLSFLFRLRGEREAPPEVVVVTMDKVAAESLDVPAEPEKWPRSLHARLTETLAKEGAAVIAFDVVFEEPRSAEDDNSFAKAVSAAGNVVEKAKRLEQGAGPNPFIDPEGYKAAVEEMEKTFLAQMQKQGVPMPAGF